MRAMVDSRCAIAITVRPRISRSSWEWIAALRPFRGVTDLGLARVGLAVAAVVADRVAQQRGVLGHHCDRGAEAFLRDSGGILSGGVVDAA